MAVGYETFVAELERRKRAAKNGAEYWRAREIQSIVGYVKWESFEEVIFKARTACDGSGTAADKHFLAVGEMVEIGSGAQRERADWILSRYACYLVAMNGESSKQEVGFAQAYFAIQARRQELQDQLGSDERRLLLRNRVKEANKSLAGAAQRAGVQKTKFPVFQDAGYKGLYGGLGQSDVKKRKGIDEKEALLDCIGRAELAANEFRITQTEQKLVRDNINTETEAIRTHHDVGREVRTAIKTIGGTMPENLSKEPPIKKLIAAKRKQLKAAKTP